MSVPATSSDRLLTTLALLKVNQGEGRTYIDSYLPFVLHCLDAEGTSEISAIELQKNLRNEFDIDLPHAVIKRILRRASEDGRIESKRGVYVVNREAIAGCSLAPTINEVERGNAELTDALTSFANDAFEMDWGEKKSESELRTYIDGFSSRVLAAAIRGGTLPVMTRERIGDQYIVQRFASTISQRKRGLFDAEERVTSVVRRIRAPHTTNPAFQLALTKCLRSRK